MNEVEAKKAAERIRKQFWASWENALKGQSPQLKHEALSTMAMDAHIELVRLETELRK